MRRSCCTGGAQTLTPPPAAGPSSASACAASCGSNTRHVRKGCASPTWPSNSRRPRHSARQRPAAGRGGEATPPRPASRGGVSSATASISSPASHTSHMPGEEGGGAGRSQTSSAVPPSLIPASPPTSAWATSTHAASAAGSGSNTRRGGGPPSNTPRAEAQPQGADTAPPVCSRPCLAQAAAPASRTARRVGRRSGGRAGGGAHGSAGLSSRMSGCRGCGSLGGGSPRTRRHAASAEHEARRGQGATPVRGCFRASSPLVKKSHHESAGVSRSHAAASARESDEARSGGGEAALAAQSTSRTALR